MMFPVDHVLDCHDMATCQGKLSATNLDDSVPGGSVSLARVEERSGVRIDTCSSHPYRV
jgi:hypothetical protein